MTQPTLPPPHVLKPDTDSELAATLAELALLQTPELKQITDRIETLKERVKVLLRTQFLDLDRAVILDTPYFNGELRRLRPEQQWRLDSKRLKRENPQVWVEYADKQTVWKFEKAVR